MNKIFIQKLKKALKTKHPIEAVNEIISEYDEIVKLASWRQKTLIIGKNLKKHQKELERIAKLLEDNGFYDVLNDDVDKDVRNYFKI